MTTDNINIILTNAICCVSKKAVEVSKLLSIGDKCAYKEALKLKMLNHYIDALRCYDNSIGTSEVVTTQEGLISLTRSKSINPTAPSTYTLYEGVDILSTTTVNIRPLDSGTTKILLDLSGLLYTSIDLGPSVKYTINTICGSGNFTILDNTTTKDYPFNIISNPICSTIITPPGNCLNSKEVDIIIEKIMTACDICACQLT